jgi:hypothetical protein
MMNFVATDTWSTYWTYLIKLPEDGSLVAKHVGVGTWHEVFLWCMFIAF